MKSNKLLTENNISIFLDELSENSENARTRQEIIIFAILQLTGY
jgi:hypothetical protein